MGLQLTIQSIPATAMRVLMLVYVALLISV